MQKSAKKPETGAARIPLEFRDRSAQDSSFMSKEELLGFLLGRGYDISAELVSAMRTPQFVNRGKYERCEFYDCSSHPQPFPYHDSDSPAHCFESGSAAPSWIKEWYMAIIEEKGERFLLLVFRPRDLFVKCPLGDAEHAIPAEMRSRARNP